MRLTFTCGPRGELAWWWCWLTGVADVTVWPDGAVVVRDRVLSPEQQVERLMAEEHLHEAQIQRGHTGPIQNQDLIPCSQPCGDDRRHHQSVTVHSHWDVWPWVFLNKPYRVLSP